MGKTDLKDNELNAKGLKIAILAARYNPKICEGLLQGALDELKRLGLSPTEIPVYRVPGAFELPWLAKTLLKERRFEALVCLAAVIRGETSHFEYVCNGVTQGLQQAMLETGVPIAFGVLTVENEAQALARSGEGGQNKGLEAARTAVEMALLRRRL